MQIDGIECYEKDGVAYLKLETVALGLDIIKTDRKNGVEYKRLNRQALKNWLYSFGILNSDKEELPDFIPENIFYRLAMKANNKVAEAFQAKIADEVIPSIRRTGSYGIANDMAQTIALLAESVERLNRRLDAMEQRQDEQSRLLPTAGEGVDLEDYLCRQDWMRKLNDKLDVCVMLFNAPRKRLLHWLYETLENVLGISLSEERIKLIRMSGRNQTVLDTIYYKERYRKKLEQIMDKPLPEEYRGW